MVSDPQDVDDIFIQSSIVSITMRIPADQPTLERKHSTRFSAPPSKKVRRGAGSLLEDEKQRVKELKEEVSDLKHENKLLRRKLGGVDGQAITQRQSIEADQANTKRLRKQYQQQSLKVEQQLVQTKEKLGEEQQLCIKLQADLSLISREKQRVESKVEQQKGVVERQIEKVDLLRAREREIRASMVGRDTYEQVLTDLDEERDKFRQLKDNKEQLEHQMEELEVNADELTEALEEKSAELAVATADPFGRRAKVTKALEVLKKETGIKPKYSNVPPRRAETHDTKKMSVFHMYKVLKGRGEGCNIELIAQALHRAGYLADLLKCQRVQPLLKPIVRSALDETQQHWTARHAVHVWDRLELSRSQMETLRHLLSFRYEPIADKYEPVVVWRCNDDDQDVLLTPVLAGRKAREREFNRIAATMNITVGENGRVERDAVECTSRLYSNFARALRKDYSTDRPAQPILFLDGTGGALGRGICHGTIGCADFVAVGDCDAKQSRATLQPLFLYEGNDHAMPLRANLELAISSYNRLVARGSFDRTGLDGQIETLPARAMTAADMQGAKTTYGMLECSHSVWCTCQRGEGGPQHRYPTEHVKTYEEMLTYIDKVVGCKIKTHTQLCSWAHYSPGVARGEMCAASTAPLLTPHTCKRGGRGPTALQPSFRSAVIDPPRDPSFAHPRHERARLAKRPAQLALPPSLRSFTPFTCSCCGYQPTETKWRADLANWHQMTDKDRAAARATHRDAGDEENSTKQHYHQELFMPPMPHHGMERCGVDNLHLLYLNLFKHLFRYTIHEGLPDTKKKMVRDYCKAAGYYSYDAASDDEDPVKHWIGREVKRFIKEAHLHLPFLLQLAAAPADCVPEMAAMANTDGEQEMEYDDEYTPSPEDIAQEEQEEPLMMRNADRWDRFICLVRLLQRPWPQGAADTDFLRKERAVEVFNLSARVANDLLALKPTMQTWVPHILVFVVPRQMVLLGDPTRRSCDACESFGAMVKKLIKHTTCRRRVRGAQKTQHVCTTDSTRRWQQTFNRGYVEQAFRRVTVRESLQHGPENAPFVQRADACRTAKGKSSTYHKPTVDLPTPRNIREFINVPPEQPRPA